MKFIMRKIKFLVKCKPRLHSNPAFNDLYLLMLLLVLRQSKMSQWFRHKM